MSRDDGGAFSSSWERFSAHLDQCTSLDRAIGVLMQQRGCDYWAARRILVVESIVVGTTVDACALRVLGEMGAE